MSLLRIIVIGTVLLALVTLWIAFVLGTKKINEQRKKAEKVKEKKVKEKKVKEKKEKRLVNPDVALALQSLGFKKQESIDAAQKAIEELGDVETEKLIKEALKQV